MLGVGILGNPWLGNLQDTAVDESLKADHPAIHQQYVTEKKPSLFGDYVAVNDKALKEAPEADKKVVKDAKEAAKKTALRTVTILPLLMFACYVGLMFYFKSRGGYRPVKLIQDDAP